MFKKHPLRFPESLTNILYVSVLVLINAFVTFYAFNRIPQNIAYDEILLGKLALMLGKQPYTLFTSFADGHATPYFYLMLLSFKLFGITNFALRLPSALAGFLGMIVFYGIAKKIFKDRKILFLPISFVVAVIFTCLRWRINFIRFSFEMPYLLLLELLSIYFVLTFEKTKKLHFLVLSGVFAAFAFHSYQPGRIFFIVPLLFILLNKSLVKNVLHFLIPFLIIVLPLIFILINNPSGDGRINQLSYMQNTKVSTMQKVGYLSENILSTGLMFIYKGDSNGRHNFPFKPALNPLVGVLFMSGLVFTLAGTQKNDPNAHMFVAYFIIALIPALLTLPSENPHMLRTYTSIPSLVIFIGLFLSTLVKWSKNSLFHILLLLVVFGGCMYDLRTYFIYQSRVMRNSFEVTCPIERVIYRNTKTVGDLPVECRIQKNLF